MFAQNKPWQRTAEISSAIEMVSIHINERLEFQIECAADENGMPLGVTPFTSSRVFYMITLAQKSRYWVTLHVGRYYRPEICHHWKV